MEAVKGLQGITLIARSDFHMQDAYVEVEVNPFVRIYTEGGLYFMSVRAEGRLMPATFPIDRTYAERCIYRAFSWVKARALTRAMQAINEPKHLWKLVQVEHKIKWGY